MKVSHWVSWIKVFIYLSKYITQHSKILGSMKFTECPVVVLLISVVFLGNSHSIRFRNYGVPPQKNCKRVVAYLSLVNTLV